MKYLIALAIVLNVAGLLIFQQRQLTAIAHSEQPTWTTYRLFEDGSYMGTLSTGETVRGCLPNGLCQD